MAENNSFQSPVPAGGFAEADAPLRQLRLPAHPIFLFLMFLLPALFGRFLFLRFTLPLAHRLRIHPAVSSVLLVNVLMLFELALLLAAFYWVQRGRSWRQLRRATYVWPIDWKGIVWSPLLPIVSGSGIFLLLTDALAKTPFKDAAARQFLYPIGLFGFVVALGLFCYEP